MDADIPWMRGQFLWDFAKTLRIDANALDALKFWDFINYCRCIDEWKKQEAKRVAAQNAQR
jgi:hypothetical protein